MASSAQALAAPDPGSGPLTGDKSIDAILGSDASALKKYNTEQDRGEKQEGEIRSQELTALHGYEDERKGLKRPEPKPIPQPVVQSTNPINIWGSTGMIVAALASLKTRQPMVSAFNAAAKVMDAYREGDQEKANAAFQSWKVASENAKEQYEYENKVYEDILSDVGHREDLTTKEADKMVKDVEARLKAAAHDFQDQVMLDRMAISGITGVQQLQMAKTKAADTHFEQGPKIDAVHGYNSEKQTLHGSPEYKKADPKARAEMDLELVQKYSHGWSDSQRAAAEERIGQHLTTSPEGKNYAAAKQNIETIEGLMKAYPNGIPGPIAQSALADAYTRLINGGMAIRGFQMKMNTEHAGLWDKVQIAGQQLGRGGAISPRMAQDMLDIAKQIAAERSEQMSRAVQSAQDRAKRLGLDPANVVPDLWDPSDAPAGGAAHGPAPKPHPVPPKFAGYPDGTPLRNGGWIWVKKGDQLIPDHPDPGH